MLGIVEYSSWNEEKELMTGSRGCVIVVQNLLSFAIIVFLVMYHAMAAETTKEKPQ